MSKRPKVARIDPNMPYTTSLKPPQIHAVWDNRREGNWTDPCASKKPPNWVLDLIAEETITGKYNTAPSNLCSECFVFRSSSKGCWCT